MDKILPCMQFFGTLVQNLKPEVRMTDFELEDERAVDEEARDRARAKLGMSVGQFEDDPRLS